MKKITDRQEILLQAIKDYIGERGYSPTVQELCKITHKNSKATVCEMLKRLKAKGLIDYSYRLSRTIRIVEEKDDDKE